MIALLNSEHIRVAIQIEPKTSIYQYMFNYIISYVVSFFIQTQFIDPTTRQSVKIGQNARLTLFDQDVGNLRMEVSLVLPLAIVCVIFLAFLFSKARLGFELRAVGMNRKASRYAGIAVGRTMVTSMTRDVRHFLISDTKPLCTAHT